MRNQIAEFCTRAAQRNLHLMTGEQHEVELDQKNFIVREEAIHEGVFTFEAWVDGQSNSVCIMGCWWREQNNPASFQVRILPR